jgi:hypothetical protein
MTDLKRVPLCTFLSFITEVSYPAQYLAVSNRCKVTET